MVDRYRSVYRGVVSSREEQPPTAVVAAGDEETRVLFRGLLRLHRVRVDGEARGALLGCELVRKIRPSVVLVDSVLHDGSWVDLLSETRTHVPTSRFILVAPASTPSAPNGLKPDATLQRPFRISAFADALGPAALDGPSPPFS